MRITCPDCQATYEVGDADIPKGGIEVECSACLNRWMQMPKGEEAKTVAEPAAAAVEEKAPSAPEVSAPESESVVMDFPSAVSPPEKPEAIAASSTPLGDKPGTDNVATSGVPKFVAEIEAPSDLAPLPKSSTGWRVPKPPEKDSLAQDPLDEILAEVDPAFKAALSESEASAPSMPETASAPEAKIDEPDMVADAKAEPIAEAESVEEAEKELEVEVEVTQAPQAVAAPSAPESSEPELREPPIPEPEIMADISAISEPEKPAALEPAPVSRPSAPELSEPEEDISPIPEAEPVVEEPAPETVAKIEDVPEPASPDLAEPSGPSIAEASEKRELGPVAKDLVEKAMLAKAVAQPPVAHWSENIPEAPEVAPPAAPEPTAPEPNEAKKGMEELIQTLSASPPSTPSWPREAEEEEEVFHPWEGEAAPSVDGSTEMEAVAENEAEAPASMQGEADDFDWEEHPDPETVVLEPEFDPAPEEGSLESEHMAAIASQKDEDLSPKLPEVSNVIQADIPQVPTATIPSQPTRPSGARPSKPTPVESAEDVEAAIRAQLLSMDKPSTRPAKDDDTVKTGIFGRRRKAKAEAAPEPAKEVTLANPLKDALLDNDDGVRVRSGRRRGFFLVIYLFLAALALYIFGDSLAALVPALEPYLSAYLTVVDKLRLATQNLLFG